MNARALTAFLGMVVAAPCAAIADGSPPLPPPPPPPPVASGCCEPFIWTGVYLGIEVGGAWSDPRWTFPFVENFNTAPGQRLSISESGTIFGGYGGVNYQINRLVIGAELSYADNGESGQVTGPILVFPLDRFAVKVDDLFTVAARLGYAYDQFLFYGKVGFASSRVELGAHSFLEGVAAHASQRENGWIIGAGFDARMVSNLLFGVEYNFVDLPGGRFTGLTVGAVPGAPFNVDIGGTQVQTIMARFSILFGPTACCGEGLLGKY